jgi:hypothetical protein
MKTPGQIKVEQQKTIKEQASQLATRVTNVLAHWALIGGESREVTLTNVEASDQVLVLVEDMLGEAGWLKVHVARRVDKPTTVLVLLTVPKEW